MNLTILTPWQQLFWLVCLVLLTVPIISWGVIGVIRGYFNAKEAHIGKIANAVSNALKNTFETLNKQLDDAKKELTKTIKKKEDGENGAC